MLDTFFSVVKQESSPGSVKAWLSINKDHDILKGHFPGKPIVPGVCMMQIITELMELRTKRNLRIKEAQNMKFLSVIDPVQNNIIEASVSFIEDNSYVLVDASLFAGSVIFFKLKAILQHIE